MQTSTYYDTVIIDNIFKLLKARGMRQADISRTLGVSQDVVSLWHRGKTRTYMDYLPQIASYLGVTEEDLLHPDRTACYELLLSKDERELVKAFRDLTEDRQSLVIKLTHKLKISSEQFRYLSFLNLTYPLMQSRNVSKAAASMLATQNESYL